MMITLDAIKQDGFYYAQPAVRLTAGKKTLNNLLSELLTEDNSISIKRFDDDHAAVRYENYMTLFMTSNSPWYNYVDSAPFWNEKQRNAFNTLCAELEASEEFDPTFCYEL